MKEIPESYSRICVSDVIVVVRVYVLCVSVHCYRVSFIDDSQLLRVSQLLYTTGSWTLVLSFSVRLVDSSQVVRVSMSSSD